MKRFVIALAAFSMMTPVAAFAQDYYHHRDHHPRVEKRVIVREKIVTPRHHERRWARGHYLPRAYWGRVVVYNRYHLARPERGRVWVHVGNQFLLINPRTGYVFATATPR